MAGFRVSDAMRSIFFNKWFILICRIIVGAVFIYASLDKISNPLGFSDNIDNYHFGPVILNNLIALILPWMEFIIGLCLLSGIYIRGASVLSTFLLLLFILLISQAFIRGIDLHCGCFKTVADPGITDLRTNMLFRIIEDVLLAIGSFLVSFAYFKKENKSK